MKQQALVAALMSAVLILPHTSAMAGTTERAAGTAFEHSRTDDNPMAAWATGCRLMMIRLKKKPLHRAFATAMDQEGQSCISVWGRPSKEAAERDVLKECRNYAGRGCFIEYSE